jgi:AAA family ATPase
VVKSVNSGGDTVARHAHTVTTIRIRNPSSDDTEVDAELEQQEQRPERLRLSEIPGLADAELKAINDLFTYFNVPPLFEAPARSCGIVIHGMRKSGKTFILEKIADTNWGRVFRLEPNAKSSEIDEIFEQARAAKPSIVLIDNLHNLVSKDRPNSGLIVQRLCKQLDQLSAEAKVSKGTFQVLVVASCLDYKSDVPMDLQGSTRFDANITLAIPDAAGRRRILEAVCADVIITERDAALSWLAEDTHAFNTGDLCSLMNTAIAVATRRVDDIRLSGGIVEDVPPVILSDLQTAFRTTRPSAMHDVTLKPPTIHWRDIGGQEEVKKALQRQIAITKSTDTKLKKVMLHPPKGILLYGPPGCSKTLSAQAVATESGFNFFAVKGAELLNMYVGESERAIRNLFERARSASPSIIFFDEIDSIGSQRASGAGAGAARSQGSVNVLTTLLTEMDGFEPLTGVLVLAATNRPEVIDTALLRPGRFDRWIYVGLPDLAAREAIIKMNMDRLLTAPDLDIPDLARRTEGFSGAELTQICSKSTERVADAWLDGEIAKDELMIDMRDVIGAIESTPRAVSQDMLDDYDEFAKRLLR